MSKKFLKKIKILSNQLKIKKIYVSIIKNPKFVHIKMLTQPNSFNTYNMQIKLLDSDKLNYNRHIIIF